MSASTKKPAFPLDCANAGCAKALAGPVKFCPYCGASSQVAVTAVAAAPVSAPVSVPTPTPTVAAVVAPAPVREVTVERREVEPQPTPARIAPPPLPVAAGKPRNLARNAGLAAAVLFAVVGYAAYQMNAGKAQQAFEATLQAGRECLNASQFNCALEKADQALRTDSKDPRALNLLQQAQGGLDRQQREATAKRDDARMKALAAQQALDLAAAREKAQREQEQLAKVIPPPVEKIQAQAPPPPALPKPVPTARPAPPRPTPTAASPGLVGQQLSQARSALSRGDGNMARALANMVLSQDPNSRQAQIVLRQAEQLRNQSSFSKPKALGGVIIE